MNLFAACNIFIQNLKDTGLSKHTILSYQTDLTQFINHIGESLNIDDLNYEYISDFFASLQSKNLARSSLKRKRTVLQRFLTFCYEKRLCKENHGILIDPMRTKNISKPKDILNAEEITKIMVYLDQKIKRFYNAKTPKEKELLYVACRNRLLIYILLYTGCRSSEGVSIKKSDISMENNTIGILAKGSKYNNVPIHHKLKKAFKDYNNDIVYLKKLGFIPPENIYLFPSRRNKNFHLSTRTLYDIMIELSEVLNRAIHAHLFRHTFASYSIASGMNVGTLASIISHSNPAITLSIYTHEIESRKKQEEMKKLQFEF